MTRAGEKIIEGLNEALAHARALDDFALVEFLGDVESAAQRSAGQAADPGIILTMRQAKAAKARIEQLEAEKRELALALRPFAEAAANVPDDQPNSKVVASVPAGPHAAAFQRMSALLTAASFRQAAAVLAPVGQNPVGGEAKAERRAATDLPRPKNPPRPSWNREIA